jgi:hypothetical protein
LLLPFHWPHLCACCPCNAFVAVSPWLAFVVATLSTVSPRSMACGMFTFATLLSTLSSSDCGNPAAYFRGYPCPVFQLHDGCMPHNIVASAFESDTLPCCNFCCLVQHRATPAMDCIAAEIAALPIPHQPAPHSLLAMPSLPFWPAHLLIVAPIGSFKSIPSRLICSTHWLLP